jgi:formate dehydrogenase iron-sulfur subunit
VDRQEAVQASEAHAFLPGVPGPADTLPTTVYKTERVLPRNMLPADFYSVHREHAHPPLVVMLVLTQLSVGAFIVSLLVRAMLAAGGGVTRGLEIANAVFALALGLAALGASTLHLGRPQYAFRALLGLRTSWLSREILTFSAFAGLAAAFAASYFASFPIGRLRTVLSAGAALAGAAGVFCSVMVYAATKRAHWRGSVTGFKFGLTAVVLGTAAVAMVSSFFTGVASRVLVPALMSATALKLLAEAATFRHLGDRHHSAEKRAALLMKGDLGRVTVWRFLFGGVGGLVLPALGLLFPPMPGWVPIVVFLLLLAGELCERTLFFAAAPASKMPGGIG